MSTSYPSRSIGKTSFDGLSNRLKPLVGLAVLFVLFLVLLCASLSVGARSTPLADVWGALWSYNENLQSHLVIHDLRLPRTIIGVLVGVSLAVSGVLMQAMTRNPLADPGLLGINAGASFSVVLAIWLIGIQSSEALVWFALLGAGVNATLVYLLSSLGQGRSSPVSLVLAGAAISALLLSLVSAILIQNQETLQVYRFWVVGSLLGSGVETPFTLVPFIVVGVVLSFIAARALNAIALGEDTASALGVKITQTRMITLAAVTLLCGSAVALAGPIGFVGLVIPHVARFFCGVDNKWIIMYSLLLGPIILIFGDIVGRIILPPGEIQVGIMISLIGGPIFVWIVRNAKIVQL